VGYHADGPSGAYGYWRPLRLECACSCYRPLFTQRSRTEQRSDCTQLMRERMSVGRARHLGTAPMDCSCDARAGKTPD
jgi:hypothetical protein